MTNSKTKKTTEKPNGKTTKKTAKTSNKKTASNGNKPVNKDQKLFIWSTKMGEKGQIVIPKEAREVFNINKGDCLLLFGDTDKGIAIAKQEDYLDFAKKIFEVTGND